MYWNTRLAVSTVVLPFGSFIGITEKLDEVDATEFARDLNNGLVTFSILGPPKWSVSLSASGPAVRWAPAFAGVRKGDPCVIQCITPQTSVIPAGATFVVLNRRVVPGSVRVRRLGDEEEAFLPFTLDGQTVSVAQPAPEPLVVTWRMELDAVLASRSLSMPEIEGRMDWAMNFLER